MTEDEITTEKTGTPPVEPALAPKRYAALPEEHRHRARRLTFAVVPYHECEDRICRERQLRMRQRMMELIEVFTPEDIEEVDNQDPAARRTAGVPDIWTYDATDENHPVTSLDDLALLELDDGRRLIYVIVDVPPLLAPPVDPPPSFYG